MADEFYLTLVSNNLTDENNTIASFTTTLPRKLEFDSSWRVGLSEISFTKSWFNLRRDSYVTFVDEQPVVYVTNECIKAGFYAGEREIEAAVQKVLDHAIEDLDFKKIPSVELDTVSRRVNIITGIHRGGSEVTVLFDEQLSNMFGLEYNATEGMSIKGGWKPVRAYDLNAGIYNVFVYCDLISPSFVGDSFSQVIRTVSIPSTPFGQECFIHYNPIQYHKLNRGYFDRIEIQLSDDSGELIPFEFGRSKLTLHFKKDE